jgi:GDP-mannose transporter
MPLSHSQRSQTHTYMFDAATKKDSDDESEDVESGKVEKERSHTEALATQALIACLMYCLCSLLMTFSNKMILASSPVGYDFRYPSVLLLYQSVFSTFFVYSLKILGLITIEPMVKSMALKWLPVNVLFVLMLLSATYALRFLSVPMVTIFKNFTTMFITLGDYFYFGQQLSPGIIASLVLMFFGSVVAAINDLEFRLDGYLWMIVNCVISAAYVLYMKTAMKGTKLSEFGSVYYNNFLSIPLVLLLVGMDGLEGITDYPLWKDPGFIVVTLFSGFSSVCISFASFWTVKATSPTTYSVVGSLNKIPLTIMGVLVFSTTLSNLGAISIVLGLSGGVVYSLCKHREWSTRETKK